LCDIENLPFREGIFSCVFSIAVLHHVLTKLKRKLIIENISKILHKKGSLILSVWSKYKGRNSNSIKKGNYSLRMRNKIYRYVFHNSTRYKLQKNEIYLPWRFSEDNGRKMEVARIYHLFNNNEIQYLSEKPENPWDELKRLSSAIIPGLDYKKQIQTIQRLSIGDTLLFYQDNPRNRFHCFLYQSY